MSKNDFLTIQEFIQKYEVADIRIRRRIRKYRLTDPQKLEGNLSEKYEKGVGNIILLKEDFWAKELEAVPVETAYAVPLRRSPDRLSGQPENDQNRLSGTPDRLSGNAYAVGQELSDQTTKQTSSNQVIVEREFLEILKEDRAEKKEWIQKYESLLADYKAKDNQLAEREKFFQGLVGKVIDDARNTKHLLMSQISHLQKQLHVPKKREPVESEEAEFKNGNFTENKTEDNQDDDNQNENNQKEGD